jgi:hypothetical protein
MTKVVKKMRMEHRYSRLQKAVLFLMLKCGITQRALSKAINISYFLKLNSFLWTLLLKLLHLGISQNNSICKESLQGKTDTTEILLHSEQKEEEKDCRIHSEMDTASYNTIQ